MKPTSRLHPILLAASALAILIPVSSAAVVIEYNSLQIANARVDGPYTIGNVFRVNQPLGIIVTHLGIQDVDAASDAQDPDGADGLTGFADNDGFFRDTFGGGAPLSVGLWSADGLTLLASATVSSTDPVVGSYRYVTLATPVTLATGTSYLLGANIGGGIEWFLDNPTTAPFSAGSGITLEGNRYAIGGELSAPVTDGGLTTGRWAPANAQFIVVPEPHTLGIGLIGSVGLFLRRRRAR
jgi:hypothetical protein